MVRCTDICIRRIFNPGHVHWNSNPKLKGHCFCVFLRSFIPSSMGLFLLQWFVPAVSDRGQQACRQQGQPQPQTAHGIALAVTIEHPQPSQRSFSSLRNQFTRSIAACPLISRLFPLLSISFHQNSRSNQPQLPKIRSLCSSHSKPNFPKSPTCRENNGRRPRRTACSQFSDNSIVLKPIMLL